jgi:probable selenate reductase FAD-binding subunit
MLRNVKTYVRPGSIEDAVTFVQSTPNAVYLGGGAWTVAQGHADIEAVADLQALGLDSIEGSLEDLHIGSMVRLQQLIDHADVGTVADGILAQAARFTQSRSLREQGTVGGTLIIGGNADPLTTALLALDSTMSYADPVLHTAPFASFVAYRDRLVKTRVLITAVHIKRSSSHNSSAFEVVGRSPRDKPIVCAAVTVTVDEGLPAALSIAVGGVDLRPVRLYKTEHVLRGQLLNEERVAEALVPALQELQPVGDYRGSAEYRLAMAKVLVRRAVLSAWERARRQ